MLPFSGAANVDRRINNDSQAERQRAFRTVWPLTDVHYPKCCTAALDCSSAADVAVSPLLLLLLLQFNKFQLVYGQMALRQHTLCGLASVADTTAAVHGRQLSVQDATAPATDAAAAVAIVDVADAEPEIASFTSYFALPVQSTTSAKVLHSPLVCLFL